MNEISYGYPITNGREYIILILLIYLINRTNIRPIILILCIIFVVHLYKLFKNYEINESLFTEEDNIIHNLSLVLALILLINNNNYVLFSFIFIITGVIYRTKSRKKYVYNEIINGQDILIIISSFALLNLYPNYRYKFIFAMEILNHGIILLEKI